MAAQFIRKLTDKTPLWLIRWMGNLWPPYLGAGIRIVHASADFRHIKVTLKNRWYNKNYVGTQFGGSIYSMTDPFYMLMILNNLGKDYIVWDKAAKIEFHRPGTSALFAEFRLSEELIKEILAQTSQGEKHIFDLPVKILNSEGLLVATVEKTLYVRKKKTVRTG